MRICHCLQRWKKQQTWQINLCYFSPLVLIFGLWARKIMIAEYYNYCFISTRATSSNKQQWYQHQCNWHRKKCCFLLFSDFSWSFWWFMLFVVTPIRRNLCFFGANICGPNLHRCYSKCFFHLWFQGLWMIKIVSPSASRFRKIRGSFISKLDQGKRLWGKC